MKGFSDQFKDFPDYILGITKEIWEDRGLATLNHYYSKDIPVRSPGSIVFGNDGVIAATMSTLAEFPDRRLLGEDVIWSGSPEEGMLSSHRILTTATHLGDGVYGKASGKKLRYISWGYVGWTSPPSFAPAPSSRYSDRLTLRKNNRQMMLRRGTHDYLKSWKINFLEKIGEKYWHEFRPN